MEKNERGRLIGLPKLFFEDHSVRCLPTPIVIRETKAKLFVQANDPALDELLNDAEFYADPFGGAEGLEFPYGQNLVRSAKATIRAIRLAREV